MNVSLSSIFRRGKSDPPDDKENLITLFPLSEVHKERFPPTAANVFYNVRHWDNGICTSLYHWWNFLPLNLFQQCIIPSNLYYIVMAILQLITVISDSDGIPTYLLPLGFVMFITMLKDAYEDVKRHQSNDLENQTQCLKHENGEFQPVNWETLRPGDIVKIHADEGFPADLILLSCSDPDGISYVGTVQLDGESNLKHKLCLPELHAIFKKPAELVNYELKVTYSPPDAKLYTFIGKIFVYQKRGTVATVPSPSESPRITQQLASRVRGSPGSISIREAGGNFASPSETSRNEHDDARRTPKVSFLESLTTALTGPHVKPAASVDQTPFDLVEELTINLSQFLWRGATLTNTEWIVGLVVYSGHRTKIILSSKSRNLKFSKMSKAYNKQAIILACTQFLLCLVAAILFATITISADKNSPPELRISDLEPSSYQIVTFLVGLGVAFGRYVLLLSYFVPITLLVQLEMIRVCQAYFLNQDQLMQSSENGLRSFVQTTNLLEELGNITHVFTDKTGTLTANVMELKCVGSCRFLYGFVHPPAETAEFSKSCNMSPASRREIEDPEQVAQVKKRRCTPNRFVDFDAWHFLRSTLKESHAEKEDIRHFIQILGLCHSVLTKKKAEARVSRLTYRKPKSQASSDLPAFLKKDRSCESTFDDVNSSSSRIEADLYEKYLAKSQFSEALNVAAHQILRWNGASEEDNFDASSPDELALINGCAHIGMVFLKRPSLTSIQFALTNEYIRQLFLTKEQTQLFQTLLKVAKENSEQKPSSFYNVIPSYETQEEWTTKFFETEECPPNAVVPCITYNILEVLDFDNFRKKMSVIVQDPYGKLILLVKGADSSMLASAIPYTEAELDKLRESLTSISQLGLRTLVFGYRYIRGDEFIAFKQEISEIRLLGSETQLTKASDDFEQSLILVGCTGIDDKLQQDVPATIQALKCAGIKVWTLTGDKLETAISIGHSCNLLTEATFNAIVNGTTEAEIREQLHQYMTFIVAGQLAIEAFDQLAHAAHARGGDNDDDDDNTLSGDGHSVTRETCFRSGLNCVTCGSIPGSSYGNSKPQSTRVLLWEDFLALLRFQAFRKKVIVEPYRPKLGRLSSKQVEEIIESYLQSFAANQAPGPSSQPLNVAERAENETQRQRPASDVANADTDLAQPAHPSQSRFELNPNLQQVGQTVSDSEHGADEEDSDNRHPYRRIGYSDRFLADKPPSSTNEHDVTPENTPHCYYPPSLTRFGERAPCNCDHPSPECAMPRESSSFSSMLDLDRAMKRSSTERKPPPKDCLFQEVRPLGWKSAKPHQQDLPASRPLTLKPIEVVPVENLFASKPDAEPKEVRQYTSIAITVSGEALAHILVCEPIKRYFFGLANLCDTVIACRVTPKQKAEIVEATHLYFEKTVSLGIGDGANDVSMLVTANVGVGIAGKEGSQAIRASDFVLQEFRFLRNLLLYHGHENLRRNSVEVYITIFKNAVLGAVNWFYSFVASYSASDLFNIWIKQTYNIIFTSIPIILYAIFDRLLPTDVFLECPWLYPAKKPTQGRHYYATKKFILWFGFGLYSAAMLVLLPATLIAKEPLGVDGMMIVDVHLYGFIVYGVVVAVANFVLIPYIHAWFWFVSAGFSLWFLLWIIVWAMCSDGFGLCSELCGTYVASDANFFFHLAFMLTIFVILIPFFTLWLYQLIVSPDEATIIRERIALGVFDVVVAPQQIGGLTVVVPRNIDKQQWRGFAFSEGSTRFQLQRRLATLPQQVKVQTAALRTIAGDIFYGSVPMSAPPHPGR